MERLVTQEEQKRSKEAKFRSTAKMKVFVCERIGEVSSILSQRLRLGMWPRSGRYL